MARSTQIGNYRWNQSEWNRLAMSDTILRPCLVEAAKAKAFAESIAPRSKDERGGHYADHFDIEWVPVVIQDEFPAARWSARVVNDHPLAAALEFGNARTDAQRILGRAAASIGTTTGGNRRAKRTAMPKKRKPRAKKTVDA